MGTVTEDTRQTRVRMFTVSSTTQVTTRPAGLETKAEAETHTVEGLTIGKEDITAGNEGLTTGKEDITEGKEGLTTGKEDIAEGKDGLTSEKEDLTPGKEDMTPEKPSLPSNYARTSKTESVQLNCCQMGDMEGGKVLLCNECNETVITYVTTSKTTFGLFWLLCCLTCCCCHPVSFLPCCIKNFNKNHHRCPNCKGIITTSRHPYTKQKICFLILAAFISFFGGPYVVYIGLKYIGII